MGLLLSAASRLRRQVNSTSTKLILVILCIFKHTGCNFEMSELSECTAQIVPFIKVTDCIL